MNTSLTAIFKTFSLILLTILLLGLDFNVKAQPTGVGKVTGQVFDQQDALILGNEVIIVSQDRRDYRISILPNSDDGKYTLKLLAGIYTVTMKQGTWYAVKRAAFLVRSDRTTVINLNPTIRVFSVTSEVTSKKVHKSVKYNRKPRYEEFFPFADSPFNVVIEYGKRKRQGLVSEYRSAKLTYNNLSIYADVLRLDKNNLFVEAKGNVTIDENGQRQKKQSASLQITKIEARE